MAAIFWKGDAIQCLNITGDTISSLLKRSKELKDAEDTGQVTDISFGWFLKYIGVTKDKNADLWLINGQYLDPKKLYVVATTDYLANGDTGYAMLKGAEPPPSTPLSQMHLRDLAETITQELNLQYVDGSPLQTPDADVLAAGYLDRLDRQQVFSQMPAPRRSAEFLDWVKQVAAPDPFSPDLVKPNPASTPTRSEQLQQRHTTWTLDLYKLDVSASLFKHPGIP